jgi:serine/threonine protein kinase
MPDREAERDERIGQLLQEALDELRANGTVDAAVWQARYPDLADEWPALLEMLRDLDTALDNCKPDPVYVESQPATTTIEQPLQENGRDLTLGSYLLLARLGQGGMGEVFKARHQRMNRIVALKVIRKERLADADSVRRFEREAKAAARLFHPNIVTVYDADQDGETHFLAMEYVEGIDLAKLVRRSGPLPVAQACEYVRQASLGLQHAYERGLVHRDIKPANLLLANEGGVVKILDMGLARLSRLMDEEASSILTQEGEVMGTPDFMAPEQAIDPHRVDIRADIYSLGCTLYYLLTGKPPFPGGTLAQKLLWHQQAETPNLAKLRSGVPRGLVAILFKMLTKRPEDRYQTPTEVARELEPFCRAESFPVTTEGQQEDTPAQNDPGKVELEPNLPRRSLSFRRWIRAAKRSRRFALTAGYGFALLLLVSIGLSAVNWARKQWLEVLLPDPSKTAANVSPKPVEPAPVQPKGWPSAPRNAERPPGGDAKPPPTDAKGVMPVVRPLSVGAFVHADNEPPSILLQRQRDPEPWERVASGSRVQTEHYLVSLPGFRSKVYLDSKVLLTLWGNVPELSSFPPVLEATVRLHDPARAGVDLDFTLDHGRVVIANHKPKGEARVRVHFRQQTWDLTLPDAATEVALELWGEQPRGVYFSMEPGGKGPLAYIGLFTEGQARLKTLDQEYSLPNSSLVFWSSDNQALSGPETLPKLPDWWVTRPDLKNDRVVLMIAAIEDLGKKLYESQQSASATALEVLQVQIREALIPADRVLGVLCLGALDALPHLVEALEDRQYFEVRWAARYALQQWMNRSADHPLELCRTWQEKKSYSPETTRTILWLLYPFSDREIASPKTYETLIARCLNHDVLAVRELASWRLGELVPQIAKEIPYNPVGDAEHRQKVCQEWKKRLPAGTVPTRPAPAEGRK